MRQHVDLALVYRDYRDAQSEQILGFATWSNYGSKAYLHLRFLGDQSFNTPLLGAILALMLVLALRLAYRGYMNPEVQNNSATRYRT